MAAFANARTAGNTQPRGEEIASYDSYAEAQRAVDYLSDHQFNVKAVTIVGTDLKMVERITGRLNYPRAALSGAASGAWFGLFVGLLLALITEGAILNTLLFALLIGAGFGMMFGVIAYALTGGKRDFTSSSQVVASSFAVLCLPEYAGQARQLLRDLAGANVSQGRSEQATGSPPDPTATFQRPPQAPAPEQQPLQQEGQQPPQHQEGQQPADSQHPISPLPPEELPAWARDPAAFQRPQDSASRGTTAQDSPAQDSGSQQPDERTPAGPEQTTEPEPGAAQPVARPGQSPDPEQSSDPEQGAGPDPTAGPSQDSRNEPGPDSR
ncbi:MAG TPA: general stress protein [Beutenbergiaceae bacterium]|nr:general stress protein [Beutenbergiaceae bacterium]